jgi:hypothetical protein
MGMKTISRILLLSCLCWKAYRKSLCQAADYAFISRWLLELLYCNKNWLNFGAYFSLRPLDKIFFLPKLLIFLRVFKIWYYICRAVIKFYSIGISTVIKLSRRAPGCIVLFIFMSISTLLLVVLFMFMSISTLLLVVLFMFMSISALLLVALFMFMSISTLLLVVLFMFMSISTLLLVVLFMFMSTSQLELPVYKHSRPTLRGGDLNGPDGIYRVERPYRPSKMWIGCHW